MKNGLNITRWIMALIMSLFILAASIGIYAFNPDIYMNLYEKNGVLQTVGMDENTLYTVTENLIDYMKGTRETLDMEAEINGEKRAVFNEREKAHMVDVAVLFQFSQKLKWSFGILLFAILVVTVMKRRLDLFVQAAIMQAFVSLLFSGVLIVAALTDFSSAFIQFHKMFFSNDLWLLDPRTDVLIQMLPEPFFKSMAMYIFSTWLGLSIVLSIAALWQGRMAVKTYKKHLDATK